MWRRLKKKLKISGQNGFYFSNKGYCPCCDKEVIFEASNSWLRDSFICTNCFSIPRERALMKVLGDYYPDYREKLIHESSPINRGVSLKLQKECSNYSASQFYPNIVPSLYHPKSGFRSEDIENLTFSDNSFDLFITQDIMEHIFDPAKAFKEIARVLKPGGAHIFTVPLVNKARKTECRASHGAEGEVIHHAEPEYHGNPVNAKGSLVIMDWGYDIISFISDVSKTQNHIIIIDNIELGIRAEFIEVIVSVKSI